MMFSLPWYYYIFIGVFLGLFMGNPKFRQECSAILAKLMGSKKKKGTQPNKDKDGIIRGDENGNNKCVVCGNSGIMALVFDNDRWICRQCLIEIEGSRNNPSKSQRRGTHIRDIFIDD